MDKIDKKTIEDIEAYKNSLNTEDNKRYRKLKPTIDACFARAIEFIEKNSLLRNTPLGEYPSFWFMRDNHTFITLAGKNLTDVINNIKKISQENPYGMVCSVTILDSNNNELRRVGKSAHVNDKGTVDLTEWLLEILKEKCILEYKGRK